MKTSFKISCILLSSWVLSICVVAQFNATPMGTDSLTGNYFMPVNRKVVQSFNALFPAAINERWVKKASFFHVSFINKGNKVSAVFSCSGQLSYAITQLKATDIPAEQSQKIANTFPSYSIFSVKKITTDDSDEYEIILENTLQFLPVTIYQNRVVRGRKILKQKN